MVISEHLNAYVARREQVNFEKKLTRLTNYVAEEKTHENPSWLFTSAAEKLKQRLPGSN